MTSGWITDDRQPQIDLVLIDGNDIRRTVTFLVDTGYDGHLVIPPNTVRDLALTPTGETHDVTVAGGERQDWPTYRANVYWNDRLRDVEVLESDTPPLFGMAMIYDPETGHADRLIIDASDRSVLIEHRSPASLTAN